MRYIDLILSELIEIPKDQLLLDDGLEIGSEELSKARQMLKAVLSGTPLELVLGNTVFWGRRFKVDERALIPRPSTELLVEVALKLIDRYKPKVVVDMGVGSGVIAITLKLERPWLELIGIDISSEALSLAEENAKLHGVNIRLVQGDRLLPLKERFDMVVSNPPYVSEEWYSTHPSLWREPKEALVPPKDPLYFYRYLLDEAEGFHLLALELGFETREAVLEMATTRWQIAEVARLNGETVAVGLIRPQQECL